MTTITAAKTITGQKVRTSNQHVEAIAGLWQDVLQWKLQGELFAVYTNYESDYTGEYDLIVGGEGEIPQGQVQVLIPEGSYHVVEVETADPQGVFKAWQQIWSSGIPRAYTTDFEHYAADGSIRIYLSV
ncbi:effector binding domain-containing protein [Paenibacillus sp. JX-17]|uniref:Effector binding domain-containing protein n=1 Tax=Paenibacillus lacisoli TaxID=3064525 RepID=A0ABT9CFY9_9BACL|nr:effector binding domain-containing protein [Paenibacillus sp. JX-17]MDO7908167.1 effector binding domain-containing protein [Paenibacillus sp. JX-17]